MSLACLPILALLLAPVKSSASLVWEPGQSAGIRLTSPAAIVRASGHRCTALPTSADYYHRPGFDITLDQTAGDPAWLTVTYLDRGYGLIELRGTHGDPRDDSGIARLDTGKLRRAVFRLQPGVRSLTLGGVTLLARLEITAARPSADPTPEFRPAVRLNSPPNLIMGSIAGTGARRALPETLAYLHNVLPLVRALGFNGVESYVTWNMVESTRGVFDWSSYDAVADECERNGLGWFPLVVVGSAYALPAWFHDSPEFVGFRCLEHGIAVDIPSIFHEGQLKYVRRFLAEFGKHYASRKNLLGFRLGPSANYGEAQYPASGDMRYNGRLLHTHLGYWAGDPYAALSFGAWLRVRYSTIADLNTAWGGAHYASFGDVKPFLPITALNDRMRADFSTWYMGAMSDWCEQWAMIARDAMPNVPIYQSSGGWGAVEIGTDYVAHTKAMAALNGGIRLTNENDDFLNNFCVTRPAASATRFYGARFGTEPAGFSSRRGVIGRLYNILTNDGAHLFYYAGNILDTNGGVETWIRHAPLLDQRAQPANEIAAFYPDTANRLGDSIMRYLHASQLFTEARGLRSVTDYDFASEQMILDGALGRYKVLVFLAGRVTEKPVLERIDRWVRAGGIAIYPAREGSLEVPLTTVEGDASVYWHWRRGETGAGRVLFYESHPEPGLYTQFVRKTLLTLQAISPAIRAALTMQKPDTVYWSLLTTGKLALLNYGDNRATVYLHDGRRIEMAPYTIHIE